jgi:hypothetical protein
MTRAPDFAARSLARAERRDRKKAELERRRRAIRPGPFFEIDELPPLLELRRVGDGWIMRQYQPPGKRP